MADDPRELLRAKLPALFARAVAELQECADRGDLVARGRLAELAAPAAALIRLQGEGQGDLHVTSEALALEIRAQPAAPGAFGHALALPSAAARYGLLRIGKNGPELGQLVSAWAIMVSPAARALFAAASYGFELEVTRVPALGDLRATISLGKPSLPERVEFSLRIDYDELEDAREQQLGPQQLFLAGKVRIDGDVAKAMMLGMTLAQLR